MGDSSWSNQRLDLIVLQEAVSGFSGLFGYSPSIGAGNLIFSVAAVAGVDPYGNAYPAGLSVTGTSSVITGTDYVVNTAGAFFYSGTPAPANFLTGQNATFDGGNGTWTAAGNCTIGNVTTPVHSGTGALAMTSQAAGNMTAASCLTANILTQGLACNPGDTIRAGAWFRAASAGRSVQPGATFYTAAGAQISAVFATAASDTTTGYTQVLGTITAPATAAFCRLALQVVSAGGAGEIHYADDPFLANLTATPGNLTESIAPAAGNDPYGNAYFAGFTSYNAATGDYTRIHGGLGITVNDPTNAAFSGGELALASVSTPNDATQITSPMALASDVQAILALQRAASGGTPVAWFLNTAVVFPKFAFAADPATGAQEAWHNMSLTGGFSTGTNASNAANDPPQYRLNPDGTVSLRGSLACPGTGTVLGVTFATLPTQYKNTQPNPACAQLIQNNAGHFGGVALNSASQLSLWGNFTNSNNIQLDCIVQRR